MPEPNHKALEFEELPLPDPWHLYLLKTSKAPLAGDELARLRGVVSAVQRAATTGWNLTPQTFLQIWKISVEGSPALYEANLATWLPSVGLGVWPNRKPPQRPSQETAMDAAASIFSGEEPELPAYHLVHISAGHKAAEHAADKMLGQGMVQQLFSAKSFNEMRAQGKKYFVETILEPSYKRASFHIPILELAAFGSNATSDRIEEWMCGADLYLRESAEDKGVVILSRRDLRAILEPFARTVGTS
jgi:hypothetical protein